MGHEVLLGRRNTLDDRKSRRFQSKNSFSDEEVGFNAAFWIEGTSGTPFNGSRRRLWKRVHYVLRTSTKTRQGGLNTKRRTVLPKMFATSAPRCPVQHFKQYLSQRPLELRDKGLFYLAVIENPKTEVWNKKQRLGVNSIDQMMKNIIKNTPLETSSKRLSNHSARKTEVNKLRAANIERPVLFR